MADRRGTHALMTKVRQAERLLDRNELPEKPFEPWQLQLGLRAGTRSGSLVARLAGAVAARGRLHARPDRPRPRARRAARRHRPQRQRQVDAARTAARRAAARAGRAGARAHDGDGHDRAGARRARRGTCCSTRSSSSTGLAPVDARTLLAKFGLGADHVGRPWSTLSPGERTRAHLAELQARSVNLLVLDEPTNHLDLEAVEQLEAGPPRLRRHARGRHATTEASSKRSSRPASSISSNANAAPSTGNPPQADSGTLGGRSWQSPSERPRKPVATSVGPSMASR